MKLDYQNGDDYQKEIETPLAEYLREYVEHSKAFAMGQVRKLPVALKRGVDFGLKIAGVSTRIGLTIGSLALITWLVPTRVLPLVLFPAFAVIATPAYWRLMKIRRRTWFPSASRPADTAA